MSQDITLGITLKADGSDLVGEVRVSEKELEKLGKTAKGAGKDAEHGARGVDKFGDEAKKTSREAKALNAETQKLGQQFDHVQKRATLLKAAIFGLATGAAAQLAKTFIDAADTSERYATTLKVVLGDVGEANRLFDDMATFAARVPFEFEAIMGAATQLAGVVRGGREEIGQLIPIIGDIAAATGLTIEETTSQIIRMYSAGAASADLFRERGVLAALGFQAGVSYSAEETMRHVIDSWENGTSRFKGATKEMADDWHGITSMMGDKWFLFRNQVMDAAPFDYLKASFMLLNEAFDENADGMKVTAEEIGQTVVDVVKDTVLGAADIYDAVSPAFEAAGGAAEILWDGYRTLPSWAREIGLVGAMLFGRVGWGVVTAVAAANEFANQLDAKTQQILTDLGASEDLKDFLHNPTGYLSGDSQASGEDQLGAVNFTARGKVDATIAAIEERVAKLRAERKAATAALAENSGSGGGRGSTTLSGGAGADKIAALELELSRLTQIREATEATGKADQFLIDVIEAETDARQAGLEVGTDAYHNYVELALAIKDEKDAVKESEAAEKKHAQTVKEIEREYARLPKTYNEAMVAAEKWRQEALAGLDKTKAGYAEFAAEVEEIYQHQLKQAYDDHLASSRQWQDGVVRGFRKVADEAGDMASHVESVITNMASAGEDAFVELYRTGKFNFSSLADSVIEDLIRMQYQAAIAGPISGMLSSFASNLFSFGGGAATTAGAYHMVDVAHEGGMIGGPNSFASRAIDASLIDGAPRFHGGGQIGANQIGANEQVFIGHKGEFVGWPDQMRRAFGSPPPIINIFDQRGAGAPDIRTRQRRDANGMDMTDLFVPAFEQAAEAGRLDDSFGSNWGGNRRPVPGA